MFDVQIVDQYSLYSHFLDLTFSHFPIKGITIKDKIGVLNVQFKNQNANQPLLNIYLLSANNYETYKMNARSKLMKFFEDFPANNNFIIFFPSLQRVDEKVNKLLLQTYESICQDLQIVKQFPKERISKIIFYEQDKELNREQCLKEFVQQFQTIAQQILQHSLDIIEDQIYDQQQMIQEKAFSFYKFYAIQEKKAKIYECLGLKQEALNIYLEFEKFFLTQFPKSIQPIFNSIHPFDFLVKKSIETNIKNFQESGDESQSTILDFLILIQYRIIDLLSSGNQIFGVEKILNFSNLIESMILQQIQVNKEKQQFHQDEEELWGLGLLIWQYYNMKNSVTLMSSVPQNLTGEILLAQQQSQLKIRLCLLKLVEKIGSLLYGIQFDVIKKLPLEIQCQLLEETIQEQINNIQYLQHTIERNIEEQPKELFRTYLLSDSKLKGQINTLSNYSTFYCQAIHDILSVTEQLNLQRVKFEHQFTILKLKNTYPKLNIPQETLEQSLKYTQCQFKNLHSSLLIQKLIYYYTEKMELSFQDCFKEALLSNLPGSRFTKLFQILKLPLTKFKLSYIGYFEMFQIKQRISYTDYKFKFQILKYLQAECDGYFIITMKSKGANLADKRKLKLMTDIQKLREEKKIQIEFQSHLNQNQGGLYQIRKVTFQTGQFKLYFDVSQKAQQLKIHILHPQIFCSQIKEVTNLGTPILFSITDIPIEIQSFDITLITKSKLSFQLYGLSTVTIHQMKNQFTINSSTQFAIQQPFVLFLYSFEDLKDQTLKIVINLKNHQFATDIKFDTKKIIEINDLTDKVEDEFELFEITNLSNQLITLKNVDKYISIQNDNTLRQFSQKGNQLILEQESNFTELFHQFQKIEEQHFEEIKLLYETKQSIQNILDIKKKLYDFYQIKTKQTLFRISIISAFNQEVEIPYQQTDYFNIIIRIQYTGEDNGEFQFQLISHFPKQSRKIKEYFSQEKRLHLINYQCFLTDSNDFEKPQIKIFLLNEEKQYEIDARYMEIDFQIQINDQSN